MKNIITKDKLEKYFTLTTKALEEIKKSIIKGKNKQAKEIIEMASNYLSDAKYFQKKEDIVNSFSARITSRRSFTSKPCLINFCIVIHRNI